MWFSWPLINYKLGVLPFLIILAIWFVTTDYRWFFNKLSLDLVVLFIWILTFLPYILTRNFQYGAVDGKYAMITFTVFMVGLLINHYFMYYNKNPIILGRIALFIILFYFIGSIQTYFGLKVYPLAARALATGNDPLQLTYHSLGIGGFGFVYSAVFINIVILYFFIKKEENLPNIYKYLCLVVYLGISIMLISASYATSLLLLFAGTLLVFIIRGKRSLIIGIVLAIFIILLLPKEVIGYFLIDIARLFETNEVIRSKFLDFAQGFVSESIGSQTSTRGQLYLVSLETFLKNPLFGIYGPFGNAFNAQVGGHSGWFDLLAYYGLFGSLPLFAVIFLNFRKQLKFYSNHSYYRILLIAQILFIMFGFINPVMYIYQMGFVIFAVAPAIPFLPNAFSKKGNEKVTLL